MRKYTIKNIRVSKLFEVGKVYNLETGEEDANGTLKPDMTHCWVSWEEWSVDDKGKDTMITRSSFQKGLKEAEEAMQTYRTQ